MTDRTRTPEMLHSVEQSLDAVVADICENVQVKTLNRKSILAIISYLSSKYPMADPREILRQAYHTDRLSFPFYPDYPDRDMMYGDIGLRFIRAQIEQDARKRFDLSDNELNNLLDSTLGTLPYGGSQHTKRMNESLGYYSSGSRYSKFRRYAKFVYHRMQDILMLANDMRNELSQQTPDTPEGQQDRLQKMAYITAMFISLQEFAKSRAKALDLPIAGIFQKLKQILPLASISPLTPHTQNGCRLTDAERAIVCQELAYLKRIYPKSVVVPAPNRD